MAESHEIERDITRALYRRVSQMARPGAVWPQGIKIAWRNTAFTAPEGVYLKVDNMFNPPERIDIARGKYHRMEGLMQVTVMVPENGGDPFRDASLVIGYFPADLVLIENEVKVRITERPTLGPFIRGSLLPYGPHWEQPVNVNWQAMIGT